ncbi:Rossmann-like and DUF2520 domain-containing protein [Mariniphaga sediminis]|uniref:Rossmann-like and DUF2520 domain-containing protein n=1 Tax=Mariniphaga sediminis TaxID=1628158 RepID=UPI003569E195
MSHRIVFLGAGNLATRLSLELKKNGYVIAQVYSRTKSSASQLALKLQTHYTTSPQKIIPDADIYFVALKDSAYQEVLPYVTLPDKLLVHCSGSMPLSALEKYSERRGVLYPLQTFSKNRLVDFSEIPVFIEANSKADEEKLNQIAHKISHKVKVLDSEKRLSLHIAAVFACNFVNHFYSVASEILKSDGIPFDVLQPLILETAEKVQVMAPEEAQTGPAVRFDKNVISSHMDALQAFPEFRKMYMDISESIFKYHKNR